MFTILAADFALGSLSPGRAETIHLKKKPKDRRMYVVDGGSLHVLSIKTGHFWTTEAWATFSARQAIGTASPYDDINVNPSTTT